MLHAGLFTSEYVVPTKVFYYDTQYLFHRVVGIFTN